MTTSIRIVGAAAVVGAIVGVGSGIAIDRRYAHKSERNVSPGHVTLSEAAFGVLIAGAGLAAGAFGASMGASVLGMKPGTAMWSVVAGAAAAFAGGMSCNWLSEAQRT